jgi:hypothetical protein
MPSLEPVGTVSYDEWERLVFDPLSWHATEALSRT